MNKKLLFIAICLIIILAAFLFFLNKKESGILTYPFEISVWEKFLANVSQVFKTGSIKKIEVNLSQQKMKLFEGEKMVNEFLVSTGKEKTSTPTGEFKIYSKHIMVYSKLANCWLPFWVGFTSDGLYGFHEIPICQEGRKGLEELGKPASIGCVRLGIKDAEVFYKWVEVGTLVKIYGEESIVIQDEDIAWCHNFEDNLKLGETSNEVENLQVVLTKEGIYKSSINGWFETDLLEAVIVFQEKYASEVLAPWGLTKGTGFVGTTTRNKLNQLYGCQ